jgi:hypothetical protein
MPIRTVISYVFDWVLLIAIAAVSTVLGEISPNKRPFSLNDPNISYVQGPPVTLFHSLHSPQSGMRSCFSPLLLHN